MAKITIHKDFDYTCYGDGKVHFISSKKQLSIKEITDILVKRGVNVESIEFDRTKAKK